MIRGEPSEQEVEYVTEYYFDSLTGEVKARRKAIRERYIIKKGLGFDKETGEFVDRLTGKVVPKETAVELTKG